MARLVQKPTRAPATGKSDITEETRHGIAIVWLDRPESGNALTATMITALTRALERIDATGATRAVVVAARGPAFCVGAEARISDAALAKMHDTLSAMTKPTIARVHGLAAGAGIALVAACDMAVAAHAAEFSVASASTKHVIAPPLANLVISAIGRRAAQRYLLSGEPFDASEAYRIGLVQELAPAAELDDTINAMLGRIVDGDARVQAATKALLREASRTTAD